MGVGAEFAREADGRQPAEEDGAVGEGVDLAGASDNEASEEECGKKLSAPLWASEDLASGSQTQRDDVASSGSPEWSAAAAGAAAADSQRAISLDASECLAEMSNPALVRSSALEDLRAIGDKRSWDEREGEEPFCEEPTEGVVSACTQQPPSATHLPRSDPQPADVQPRPPWEKLSQKAAVQSEGAAAVNGDSDSSTADVCGDSESRAVAVAVPHSSPARKSLVPVPVSKGLFAVTLTKLSAPFSSTAFIYSAAATVCYAAPSL